MENHSAPFNEEATFRFLLDGEAVTSEIPGRLQWFEHAAPIGKKGTQTFWHGFGEVTLGRAAIEALFNRVVEWQTPTVTIILPNRGMMGVGVPIWPHTDENYYAVAISGIRNFQPAQGR